MNRGRPKAKISLSAETESRLKVTYGNAFGQNHMCVTEIKEGLLTEN